MCSKRTHRSTIFSGFPVRTETQTSCPRQGARQRCTTHRDRINGAASRRSTSGYVLPKVSGLASTRPADKKEVSQVGDHHNRRTGDLNLRCDGVLHEWVDEGGMKRTQTVVMFQPIDQNMRYVISPLALEMCLLVWQVGQSSSVRGRVCLVNIIEVGIGVIVLVVMVSSNVLSKGGCWYFFVWMLNNARLYLFNASSRHQYV